MFEIIICDDDSACLEQTNQLVNDWIETASVPVTVKTIDNGDMLLNYCNKYNPDVILLDIMDAFVKRAWMRQEKYVNTI